MRPILVTTAPMIDADARTMLAACCEIVEVAADRPNDLRREIARADAVLAYPPLPVGAEVIALAPRLKIVASAGSGVDHIDVRAASGCGVIVTNVAGVGTRSIAEHVLTSMLALSRRLVWADAQTRAGAFEARWCGGYHEISGKTLAIIGYGAVGRDLARICTGAFGMTVLAVGREGAAAAPDGIATPCDFDDALGRADIVSANLPLTPDTRHLFEARAFARMKPTALFINTGRGGSVDEAALFAALRDGTIAGAALDVFDAEPPDTGNPLLALPNLLATPHIAGMAQEALKRVSLAAASGLCDALGGKRPARMINPEIWENARLRSFAPAL
jgi:phosphoglycerate dehydrogenase-like enzyme